MQLVPRVGLGVTFMRKSKATGLSEVFVGHVVSRMDARLVDSDAHSDTSKLKWLIDGPPFVVDSSGQFAVKYRDGVVFLRPHECQALEEGVPRSLVAA